MLVVLEANGTASIVEPAAPRNIVRSLYLVKVAPEAPPGAITNSPMAATRARLNFMPILRPPGMGVIALPDRAGPQRIRGWVPPRGGTTVRIIILCDLSGRR